MASSGWLFDYSRFRHAVSLFPLHFPKWADNAVPRTYYTPAAISQGVHRLGTTIQALPCHILQQSHRGMVIQLSCQQRQIYDLSSGKSGAAFQPVKPFGRTHQVAPQRSEPAIACGNTGEPQTMEHSTRFCTARKTLTRLGNDTA